LAKLVYHTLNSHGKKSKKSEVSDLYIYKLLYIFRLLYLSLLLSRKQKEDLVIKLAKEGKTTREIAKLVHMSFKDICEIIRKVTGDDHNNSNTKKIAEKEKENKLSPCSKAFQLFRKKKPLSEVAITLDFDADNILDFYRDYLRLTGMFGLAIIYDDLGKDLSLFLHMFDRIREEGLSRDEIAYMIEMQSNIASMQESVG
jgi:hypothetical protein